MSATGTALQAIEHQISHAYIEESNSSFRMNCQNVTGRPTDSWKIRTMRRTLYKMPSFLRTRTCLSLKGERSSRLGLWRLS